MFITGLLPVILDKQLVWLASEVERSPYPN